ncbi:MAG: Wzz/FepE/Etk N-terminal domain-containing protein [Burkholderiales bacterium]
MTLTLTQCLRILWCRKWLVLLLFLIVSGLGMGVVMSSAKQYTAKASLVLDVRPDPILGPLASPVDVATQVEMIRSDKVATRVVHVLGITSQAAAIEEWRRSTEGKRVPVERFYASLLQRGLVVEPVRLSNIIHVSFTAPDSAFSAAAANAFAQAAIDTAIELKAEPSRQSAEWFQKHLAELRNRLESAQQALTKYQQQKGMVISDGQMDQETARLNLLTQQLADAQASLAGMSSGTTEDFSPDILVSSSVLSLKAQISTQEALLSEKERVWGPNHPDRLAVESRIGSLSKQLAIESERVRGGTRTVVSSAAHKVGVLKASIEEQKKRVLSLRFERDKAAVLLRDVAAAQRAYDEAGHRVSEFSAGGQTQDSSLRWLSQAVEPFHTSQKKWVIGFTVSVLGGMCVAMGIGLLIELIDRRVRSVEDLSIMAGAPVLAVLEPQASKRPPWRALSLDRSPKKRTDVPLLGARG